ncbi:TonB-dependent siderophore receptor [Pseudomonas sp. S31]|nr:TonB-dependent siderophore receptor [Pseudomonas sp. S31]
MQHPLYDAGNSFVDRADKENQLFEITKRRSG